MAAVVLAPPPLAGLSTHHWGNGGCVLQVSSFARRSPRADVVRGRGRWVPPLRLHTELYIHRFLPDGRPWSGVVVVHPPDSVHDASRLLSPSNAWAALTDMVQAITGHVGLPEEALRRVVETVWFYVREVAAWALGCGAPPPLSTQVRVTIHVSTTLLEEEAMGNINYGEQLLGSLPTAVWLETGGGAGDLLVGDHLGSAERAESLDDEHGHEEEEKEEGQEECCAICLDGMPRRQRRWLPCSHAFHGDCVGRWLLQKAECPLCRRRVEETA